MIKINRTVLLSIIALVFFFVYAANELFRAQSQRKEEYRYLALFSEVVALVKAEYVENVTPSEKFPGAYSSMISSLDRYSAYLDHPHTEMYLLFKQGKACGGGIHGIRSSGYFYVSLVTPGSPAEKAGLQSGDIIKAVNGKSIYGKSYWEMLLSLMTREPGSVELLVFRNGSGNPQKITLETVPCNLQRNVVRPLDNHPDIYYVDLSRIDKERIDSLEAQLKQIVAKQNGQPLKLILDLRRYSGGDLNSFRRVADLFFLSDPSQNPFKLSVKTKGKEESISIGSPTPLNHRTAVITGRSTILYGELLAALFNSKYPGQKESDNVVTDKNAGKVNDNVDNNVDDNADDIEDEIIDDTADKEKNDKAEEKVDGKVINIKNGSGDKKKQNKNPEQIDGTKIHDYPVILVGQKTPAFTPYLRSVPLRDGSSVLLTHGFYYLNGKKVSDSGITPHVKLSKKEFPEVINRCISFLNKVQANTSNSTHEKKPKKK